MFFVSQPITPDNWSKIQSLMDKGSFSVAFGLLDAELAIAQGEKQISIAYERLGMAYVYIKDYLKAEIAYQQAISKVETANSPILRRLYLGLGFVYQELQSFSEALNIYSKGIEKALDQAFEIINNDKADNQTILKGTTDGKNTLLFTDKFFPRIRKICSLDPVFSATRNNMGVCFIEIGDLKWAEKMFREAIEFTPVGMQYITPVKNLSILDEKF